MTTAAYLAAPGGPTTATYIAAPAPPSLYRCSAKPNQHGYWKLPWHPVSKALALPWKLARMANLQCLICGAPLKRIGA